MARIPTSGERAVIEALLSHRFEGVEALREQWANALVESSCTCGCGSLGFVFAPDHELPPSDARNPLPVEGDVLNESGEVVGGLIVLVRDGLLDDVDVHSFDTEPLPFPSLEAVRWRTQL